MRKWIVGFLVVLASANLSGCGYNKLQNQDEAVKAAWSEVVNQYQRRADLIPNLVAAVKGFAAQEERVLVGVTEARAKATSIQLTPELGRSGGGKAVVFLSPDRDDWVLVYVGGLDPKAGPYGATIQNPDGTVLALGTQTPDSGGGVTLFGQYPRSLKPFTRIVVTDGSGHVAMTGTVRDATATPTSVG